MDLFALTRALIDIDSVTPNELAVGRFLHGRLEELAKRHGGELTRTEVEPNRYNLFAHWGQPDVVLSTHMDTVPPFIASREDDEYIWGRGACDTKGIIASMITALASLLAEGVRNIGILFVVGEEVDSVGARKANEQAPGSKYLIDGEPTENKLALGSKGALRLEIEANGRMAHSAYEELGDSAINKLLDNLQALRKVKLPEDPVLGPSTCSIGKISGGRAANVIPDYAQASVMLRVVADIEDLKKRVLSAFDDRVQVTMPVQTPCVHLKAVPGFETSIVKYTTDIPKLTNWGSPLLLGPGSIQVAHTQEERVSKKQLVEAVELYRKLVKQLQKEAA
jgi:acetylornithine deacetylase